MPPIAQRGIRSVYTHKLPPMAGGSDRQDVICIEAKRVCDFCFQEHRVERTFAVTIPVGTTPAVSCDIDEQNITCRVVERREIEGSKNKILACVAVEVPVFITVGTEVLTQRVVFLKQAVLCTPEGTDIECQVTGNCCCFFDAVTGQVSCVFDFCVVIQSKANVRVLVRTLGTCAPRECRGVFACPPERVDDICDDCDDKKRFFKDRDRDDCDKCD